MKKIFTFLSVLVLATGVAFAQASSSCLEDATDRQLVSELERRLYLNDGGSAKAIANFYCDASKYFTISLINQNGKESKERRYIGDAELCGSAISQLRSLRSIYEFQVVAICDSHTYLHRYTLRPDGEISTLDPRYMGDTQVCAEQQAIINERI